MWGKMDEAANVRFCTEVEKYPCLYDSTREDYMRRDITDKAWEEVGAIVGETVSSCKERWRNLRSSYNRSLKKSIGGGSRMLRDYYLKEVMDFVRPFMKSRKRSSYIPRSELVEVDGFDDESSAQEASGMELLCENMPTMSKRRKEERIVNDGNSPRESFISEEPEKCVIEYYKSRNETDQTADMDFFKSLLPDLAKMTDRQKRQFKRKSLDLIDDILGEPLPGTMTMIKRSPAFSTQFE